LLLGAGARVVGRVVGGTHISLDTRMAELEPKTMVGPLQMGASIGPSATR
jgi:hypothetical protein